MNQEREKVYIQYSRSRQLNLSFVSILLRISGMSCASTRPGGDIPAARSSIAFTVALAKRSA